MVVPYLRFRTTYWSWNIGKETTIICCIKSEKRADLIYITVESWHHAEHTYFLTSLELETAWPHRNWNSTIVNMNPKLRLQNGIGTEDLCLKCRKNLKPRKNKQENYALYVWSVGWDGKNGPEMLVNCKLRNLKSGFFCVMPVHQRCEQSHKMLKEIFHFSETDLFLSCLLTHNKVLPGMWLMCILQSCNSIKNTHSSCTIWIWQHRFQMLHTPLQTLIVQSSLLRQSCDLFSGWIY